jgi:2-polyprenyl-6-methoxyphenol hydroxylase-like FAD-dependent oxidoreductase
MPSISSALIVGGGIAGPATALALQQAGIRSTVYEASPDGAEVGACFTIAVNGLDALDAVGALRPVIGAGYPTNWMGFRNADGRWLGRVPTGIPRADGTTTSTFRRADLYRGLAGEARRRGITFEFGKRLTGYQESASGVAAQFADGTTASADVLIGADGLRSRIRSTMDPAAPQPRFSGLLGFGGFATNPGLDPEPDGGWTMAFGRRAFVGWFVPERATEQVWWFVNVPSEDPLTQRQVHEVGMDRWSERLIELFRDDGLPVEAIVRAQGPEGLIGIGAQYDLPPIPTWHRGRVVLVGDAAHAVSTSSGQGASMALESAVTLARCLRDETSPEAAFTAYEQLRRDRVRRVWELGKRGAGSKAAGAFGRWRRDLLMRAGLRFVKPAGAAWLLQHHIDFDTPVREELARVA